MLLVLSLMAMLTALFWSYRKPRTRWVPAASFTILLGIALAMAACGGSSSSTGPPSGGGTPAGSYTITVTGTVSSGSATLIHATKLTLTVQ
jgi:hypothetical protein